MIKSSLIALLVSAALSGCLNSGPNQEKVAEAFKNSMPARFSEYLNISKVESSPCVEVNSTYECSIDVRFSLKEDGVEKLAAYKVRVAEEDGKIKLLNGKSVSTMNLQDSATAAQSRAVLREFSNAFKSSASN